MASKTPPSEALAPWLERQRWFSTKQRRIEGVTIEDTVPLAGDTFAIAAVHLDDGTTDRYALPLKAAPAPHDALDDPAFCRALLDVIARDARVAGARGEVQGAATRAFPRALPVDVPVRRLKGEQSNTSLIVSDALMVKVFRRLREGANPEQEITKFLTEKTTFRNTPRLAGYLEYHAPSGATTTLAVAQELVVGARDGWEWMLAALAEAWARARAIGGVPDGVRVRGVAGPTLAALRRLGEATGALHLALASDVSEPAFAPEAITDQDIAAWAGQVRAQLDAARAALGAAWALGAPPDVRDGLAGLLGRSKTRHHGDLHLGQTLWREPTQDFVIIDFEGEPLRPLEERRRKHTPLRDVAGVLRSIAYAAAASLARETDGTALEPWGAQWQTEAAGDFLAGYHGITHGAPFLPLTDEGFARAVAVFELEKAAYEVVYEANNRPDWVAIPTGGLLAAAARLRCPRSAAST